MKIARFITRLAVIGVALALAGCFAHDREYAEAEDAGPAMTSAPANTQVAYNGGYGMHREVRPSDCGGPNSAYSREAGGCVHRITDQAVLNRLSPRIPLGTDPKCTGNPDYWTMAQGPYGSVSIHRTCVYRR